MSLINLLFGAPQIASPAASPPPLILEAPAHTQEQSAQRESDLPPVVFSDAPFDLALGAFISARQAGFDDRLSLARAIEAMAFADLSALDIAGPKRGSERVSRKAQRRVRRALLALAQQGEAA